MNEGTQSKRDTRSGLWKTLLPYACALLFLAVTVAVAPPWWTLVSLLALPLFPLMHPSFCLGSLAAVAAAAVTALAFDPLTSAALHAAAAAVACPVLLLALLLAGHRPQVRGGLRSGYAAATRRGYGIAAAVLFLALFVRTVPIAISLPWLVFAVSAWGALPGPPPQPWTSRVTGALKAGVLFAFGLALALAVLEAGARRLMDVHPHISVHALHRTYLSSNRPGGSATFDIPVSDTESKPLHIAISRQGLRDRVFGPKEPGVTRILVLGDSFIFGWATEAEDSIPRQLERVLAERLPGSRFEVINGGLGGTGPWQHHGMLRERGFVHEPDLVLHGIYVLNDVSDSLLQAGEGLQSMSEFEYTRLVLYRNRHVPSVALHFLLDRHSHFYNALRGTWIHFAGTIVMGNHLRGMPVVHLREGFAESPRHPGMETNLADWYPELWRGFDLLTRDILAIDEDCRRRGIGYMAFNVPHLWDISEDAFRNTWNVTDPEAGYARAKGLHKLHRFLDESGMPWTDLWTPMDAHPAPYDLYYELDGHLSEEGCRLVAEMLADALIHEHPQLLPGVFATGNYEPGSGG